MPYNSLKREKQGAIDLRKKGWSYSEIQKEMAIPKSTLSFWFKNLKLDEEQKNRLQEKRSSIAKSNSQKRISKIKSQKEEIKNQSINNIKNISQRELWLLGIVMYWKENIFKKTKNDFKKGVSFSSTDPRIIKFFLRWLQEIGRIKKDEFIFDVILKEDIKEHTQKIEKYWKNIIGFKIKNKLNIYFQKNKISNNTKIVPMKNNGILRIKVRSSSMLAIQISGWSEGILKKVLNI